MPSFCMVFWWFLYFQQQLLWSFIHQKIGPTWKVQTQSQARPAACRWDTNQSPHSSSNATLEDYFSIDQFSWETVELNWSGYHLRTFSGYHAKKTPGKMCYVDDPNSVASNIQPFKIPKCLPSDSPSITHKAEVQLTIWRKNLTNPQIPTFQSISQTSIL